MGHERRAHLQELYYLLIGVKYILALELRHIIRKAAAVVNRRIDLKTVSQAAFIVILAVTRGGMHTAGSCIKGHIRRKDNPA